MEIILLLKVWLIEFPHVVVHNDNRNNKGDILPVVLIDDPKQLLPVISGQGLLKVARDMQEDIRILLHGGDKMEAFHQELDILHEEFFAVLMLCSCNEFAESAQVPGAVGEDEKLMAGMKIHHRAYLFFLLPDLLPALIGEYALNEVFSQSGIMKSAFLLNRQQGEVLHKGAGKHADPFFSRHAVLIIHFHPLHAAAGRFAFEYKPAQIFLLQLCNALSRPAQHFICIILFVVDRYEIDFKGSKQLVLEKEVSGANLSLYDKVKKLIKRPSKESFKIYRYIPVS